MKEFGECIFIETNSQELTRQMVEEAGPLVESSFRFWQSQMMSLEGVHLQTYRFVAGPPIQVGEEKWHHPFGWYTQAEQPAPQPRRIKR